MRTPGPALNIRSTEVAPQVPGQTSPSAGSQAAAGTWLPWLLLLAGLGALYVPTFVGFAQSQWRSDHNSHGPIVLALSGWYFYFQSRRLASQGAAIEATPAPVLGWASLILGLALYTLGRSQSLALLELGSLIPVLLGLVLIHFGARVASRFWFAFFLLLFAVPLPSTVVDLVTQPMKLAASYATEQVLYGLGYPVARSGVVITIGGYKLLVADACAGLNSLFTLEALGLLYMNVVRHESVFRNIALAVFIVPISFSSNVIRILILSLLTYYFGEAAGQGFMHQFSGIALFLTALMLILLTDTALRGVSGRLARLRA